MYFGTCGSIDADGDGVSPPGAAGCGAADFVDCNDGDVGVWSTPGEAAGVLIDANKTTLEWGAPDVGGTTGGMKYDTLRSTSADDFAGAPAVCVESNDGPNMTAMDGMVPAIGGTFFYLVRAENSCPGGSGQGTLGKTSSGATRIGRNCP